MRRQTKSRLTAALGIGLAVAVAVGAILVPGYSAVEPDLDSGTVWVANGRSNQIGAANTGVDGLQDILRVPPGDVRIEQSDAGILLVDATNGTLRSVVPSTASLGPTVPIPAGSAVQVRGPHVLITDPATGDVFLSDFDAVAAGELIESPIVQLGRGGTAVLGETKIFAASAGLARVITVDLTSGEIENSEQVSVSSSNPLLQLTALGDRWVLYDSTSKRISAGSWSRQLDHEAVALQEPGEAGNQVLFATDNGLVRATIGLGAEEVVFAGVEGTPNPPIQHGGCTYGVWSSGAAWRDCGTGELLQLYRPSEGASMQIAVRGASVVVTEPSSGNTWSLSGSASLISDWLEPVDSEAEEDDGPEENPVEQEIEESAQEPPIAEDDQLGARAGQVTILPVLRNDSDPNNDPLMITEVTGHSGATVTDSGQAIRLSLTSTARDLELQYTVSDGHGGEDTAVVSVDVRTRGNEPPQQLRNTSVTMGTGMSTSIDALADWIDPDGDPLTLVSVTATGADAASARPDGRLEIRDGGEGGVRQYTVEVSDGQTTETGVVLVTTTDQAPIRTDPVTAVARAGTTIELEPLLSASGGQGELRLHNVQLPEALAGETQYAAGTVSVTPAESGDFVFPYVVTDGVSTQQGQIRLQVLEPETASAAPLPLPKALALLPLGEAEIDVADMVSDPAGGSLLVTDVESDSDDVAVSLRDLQRIGIDLTGPLSEPATITYTVSNGTASAQGTISISQSSAEGAQLPIARDDETRVSPGAAVSVNVLANDEHPDLEAVTLEPDLVEEPERGIMFVSDGQLKYLAPDEPGVYTGEYRITAPDGQQDTATVTITVGAQGSGTNQPPIAPKLEARVLAGSSVDISVPLSGSDPNGDTVQLLGQSSTPSFGTLSRIDADTFRYTAGPYAAGTDVVTYVIADSGGAQAEGTLTVAVVQPDDVDLGPTAYADQAEMQPGTSLAIDVLANDVDAANLPLQLQTVEVLRGDAEAEIREGALVVDAADSEGEVGIVYTVANERGATSVAWVTVNVHEGAQPPRPIATDVEVSLASILDRESISVQPLDAVSVADGRSDLLVVSLVAGGQNVSQRGDGSLSIPLEETRQELAYRVVRTDTGDESYGIIHVPGTRDSLPELRNGTQPITVPSGETVQIDINDHIVAATGRPVWITDASLVQATHSNDAPLVRDSQTIEFTSAAGYFGPANVSLQVTDGDSPNDPDGRVGFIVLPIEVVADGSVPATVQNTALSIEPGATRDIDLGLITTNPAAAPLTYSVLEQSSDDVSVTLIDDILRVEASPQAVPNSQAALSVGVRTADTEGVPGTITMQIVSSTRPLVVPARDSVDVQRGQTEVVNPLQNDEPTNPFDQPLTIDQVQTAGAGISATVGSDGRSVQVQASSSAEIQTVSVRYRVLDATRDPSRAVWGTITVRVQDVPDRPSAPVQASDAYEEGVLMVSVDTPNENNSPLTGYTLHDQNGTEYACPASGECRLTGLQIGADYRFTAVAHNALGSSDRSEASETMRLDTLPQAVTGVRSRPTTTPGVMQVSWNEARVPGGGSDVTGYIVRVSGPGANTEVRVSASSLSTTLRGLTVGETYTVTVAATNDAGVDDDMWRTSSPLSVTAVGRPGETTVVLRDYDDATNTVGATWSAPNAGGASELRYRVEVILASEQSSFTCRSSGDGAPQGQAGRGASDLAMTPGERNVVAVIADNGWFCQTSFSPVVQGTPGPLSNPPSVELRQNGNVVDARAVNVPQVGFGGFVEALVTQGGDEISGWRSVSRDAPLTSTSMQGLEYGQPIEVIFRQCIRDASFGKKCGDATASQSVTPLSLVVDVTCTAGDRLDLATTLPDSAAEQFGVRLRVGGSWQDHPAWRPVPEGTTNGQVVLTATSQGTTYTSGSQGFSCQN